MLRRKHVLQVAICIALVMVMVAGILQTSSAKAVTTTCTTYSGTNVEYQNYTTRSSPITSYLHYCSDGSIMRVQSGSSIDGILVEYYDTAYNIKSSKIVAKELPIFGGFYAMGGYYYLLTGQNNPNDSDSVEVFRITKYDTNWKRIGSASLYGANTYIPFDAGSARFASTGNYLLIRTAHEMYAGSDGVHHQANVTIQVDTSTMKITDSHTSVANVSSGYVSHSFNQFIQIENNKIVAVDHGDAYPRSIVLTKYSKDVTTGTFNGGYGSVSATNLITFEGAIGANYTGASIGGFEISSTAYLVAGSQDIDASSNYTKGRNIFIAVQNKSTGAVTVNKITNYAAGSGTTSTPHLVKMSSNNYLLLWSRGTTVYYTQIDGNGKQVGSIYSMVGNLSDCVPVLISGKLIWYTWNNGTITFYEIPVNNLAAGKRTVIENGHKYQLGTTVTNGTVSRKCTQCGISDTVTVPTEFSVYWRDTASTSSSYWSSYSVYYMDGTQQLKVGTELSCWLRPKTADYDEMVVESSNSDVIAIGAKNGDMQLLSMQKAGISVLTVYPKYNPGIARTYTIRVGANGAVNLSSCTATLSQTKYTYTGSAFLPAVTVKSGNVTLVENTDYTVAYSNNTNAGTATVTITGKGLFTGSIQKTFTIEAKKIADSDVKLGTSSYTYDGTAKQPAVTVTTSGKTLINGTDYTVAYTNNINKGTATATITGKGNYSGTISKTFTIAAASITDATVTLGTTSYTYDGTAKQPAVTVKVGSRTLTNGTDYTVSYANNTNAGTATVTVTGKGNYTGTATTKPTFKINAASIAGATVTLGTTSYTYDGTAKTPTVTVKIGSKTLTNGTDYTVAYANNTNAGTATVTVTGKGNYTGTATTKPTFKINAASIAGATVTLGTTTYTYDGTAKQPAVTVKVGSKTLTNGTDYTVAYANNTNAGTATVTVTGKGNYTGTATAKPTFKITTASISSAAVTLGTTSYEYDGTAKQPSVTVKVGSRTLISGTDYTVAYANNTNVGTATVTVTGKGNYTGTATSKPTFKITAANLSNATVTLGTTSYTYDGAAKQPTVTVKMGAKTLTSGTDYTVSYANNTNAGTATVTVTGKGNYTGTKTATFKINATSIAEATVTVGTTSYTYDGTAKKPSVTVKMGSKTLTNGADYTVSYTNNTNVGTAMVTITGKGNYAGTKTATFRIDPISITGAVVTLGTTSYTYDGTAKKPDVTVKVGSKTLTSGTDYTVAYTNNTNVGAATVTVTGKGNYAGTIAKNFQIVPAAVKNLKMTPGDKSVKLTWDAAPGAAGYRVYRYNTSKNCWTKIATVTGCTYTDTGRTPGARYKYAVRSYNTVNGETYVSKTYPSVKGMASLTSVTGFSATTTTNSVTFSWNKVDNAAGYRVYRYNTTKKKWEKIASTTKTTYTDTGRQAGTKYLYTIRAYRVVNGVVYLSPKYSTFRTSTLPEAVSFTVSAGSKQATVNWSKVTGATSYRVYYKTSSSGSWKKLADTTKTSYTKTGLTTGQTYYFTVRAVRTYDGMEYLSKYSSKSVKIK